MLFSFTVQVLFHNTCFTLLYFNGYNHQLKSACHQNIFGTSAWFCSLDGGLKIENNWSRTFYLPISGGGWTSKTTVTKNHFSSCIRFSWFFLLIFMQCCDHYSWQSMLLSLSTIQYNRYILVNICLSKCKRTRPIYFMLFRYYCTASVHVFHILAGKCWARSVRKVQIVKVQVGPKQMAQEIMEKLVSHDL